MTANQSNLTPEQRLEAMVYKVAPWAPNPAEFNKATTQIALSLLKRLDAAEAPCVWILSPDGDTFDSACGCIYERTTKFCSGCGHPVQVKQEEDSHD